LLSPRLSLPFAKERDGDNQRDATVEQLLHLITSAANFLPFFFYFNTTKSGLFLLPNHCQH